MLGPAGARTALRFGFAAALLACASIAPGTALPPRWAVSVR